MHAAPPRPPARSRRAYALAAFVLFDLFAGLAAVRAIPREKGQVDAEKQQELSQARLSGERSTASPEWPQWLGPNRDGVAPEKGLLATWPTDGPRKLWERTIGEGYSSLAVAGGRVYSMTQDGANEAVVCWDAADGKELWRHAYPAQFRESHGNGPRATPTVAGGLVFTVGATGMMHCLKAGGDRAEVVWSKDLMAMFDAEAPRWGVSFSPLVEGERVFIQPGGRNGNSVAALETRTGALLWKQGDDPPSYSSPIATTIGGARQVLFFTGTHLIGVAPMAGELLWRFPWKTDFQCNIATPTVANDYVLITSNYDRGCAVLKIAKDGGVWTAGLVYKNRKLRSHFSTPIRWKDHVYGFDDANLVCLDFRTGEVRWKERGFGKGSLLIADGLLIVYGESGEVALAEASPEAYRERSRFRFSTQGASCWSVPALAEGRLYLRDQEKLACYIVRE